MSFYFVAQGLKLTMHYFYETLFHVLMKLIFLINLHSLEQKLPMIYTYHEHLSIGIKLKIFWVL